jgi:hypothetical protein
VVAPTEVREAKKEKEAQEAEKVRSVGSDTDWPWV